MHFLQSPPNLVLMVLAVSLGGGIIRADHVWEDFPGGEIKGLPFSICIKNGK